MGVNCSGYSNSTGCDKRCNIVTCNFKDQRYDRNSKEVMK